jgi:anti-anti-sigma regulatory factor
MPALTVCRKVDETNLTANLHEVAANLDAADRELVLDFSSVRRTDSSALRALAELAGKAGEHSVKVTLRDVNVEIYKTLKLVKLTSRFSFVS